MSNTTYYQRNKDVISKRAKDYYESDKERLRKKARDKYRDLSEEEKIKRENMEERDTAICLKKRKKNYKNIKKITVRLKHFDLFFFSFYKTWNKKQFILKKIASLKVLFIKIKDPLILMKYNIIYMYSRTDINKNLIIHD